MATKTLQQALTEAGLRAKVRRTNKRWPKRVGDGKVLVEMVRNREYVPMTGFANSFVVR